MIIAKKFMPRRTFLRGMMGAAAVGGHGAGDTPAEKNLPKFVQFLAEKGANIEVWNRQNKWG